ncbi:MAG: hypothetical protein COA73_04865 [Candidatus Hydrogenedentota bacterium]|nr:MAG: hypothetical protein COA73_04865 [Candidatus Hydrogenedentota bacterium]
MSLSGSDMRALYDQTVVVRRPRYGIVTGYHELPYVCIGESFESGYKTTCVRGKVHVSPRFIIRPAQYESSYDDIFGEDNVDSSLAGRIFGFMGFQGKPVECTSEYLEVKHVEHSVDRVLNETLDELERQEDITTGVVISPNAQYYPVSIEKFISSILDDEFN